MVVTILLQFWLLAGLLDNSRWQRFAKPSEKNYHKLQQWKCENVRQYCIFSVFSRMQFSLVLMLV